ncbi:aldehyde ferredoxin oxidoreductase C-terminal domain-containing protein [Desulfolucanica intricata]|uniref:aldehyde ferredoxin oxidoreductase C-terminal domain-containing protein n=1 Tax=Desulfolucanica intricata TaxID=1285191 RepID=UPI003F76F0BB
MAWALEAHCDICDIIDLDAIAEMNYICNGVGLDTIEAGGTLNEEVAPHSVKFDIDGDEQDRVFNF